MEESYNTIPYPNFSISSVITQKAKNFVLDNIESVDYLADKQLPELIRGILDTLNNDKDRLQFCVYLIHHINTIVAAHEKVCTSPNCGAVPNSQDILYYIYGQLNDYGVDTDVDSFTTEETYANNDILNKIILSLEELKAGQEIIYDELDLKVIDNAIEEAESLQGLQVLGRKKWLKLVGGFMMEYGTTKILDEVFRTTIIPFVLTLSGNVATYFLLN